MQPERFARELLTWISADPDARARSFADAGYRGSLYGVELGLPSGAVLFLQVVGTDVPAQRGTLGAPVYGMAPSRLDPVPLPPEGPTELAGVERWLAGVVAGARSPEIEAVALFQNRNGRTAIPHGLAVTFHSGAKAWVYFRHVTPAGREPGAGPVWRALGTV